MSRRSTPYKSLAERRYPNKVNIPVPDRGLGRRLNAMVDWCAAEAKGEWDKHGHTDRAGAHHARFYFELAEDAQAFSSTWSSSPNSEA